MLPETVTQTVTQKTQNRVRSSTSEGFIVCDLCSVLCDHPEMDGGRGRPEESLPTTWRCRHTRIYIYRGCVLCALSNGAGLRGIPRHTCVLHNSSVISRTYPEPPTTAASALMPAAPSHCVRVRNPGSMRLRDGQGGRPVRTNADPRIHNPWSYEAFLSAGLGATGQGVDLVSIPSPLKPQEWPR